ncbi:MAG: hypothetical protein K0S65_3513 [Labilithrix sp.]|nr:hypothetical protein [Labilithrix sp.]
MHSHIGHTLRVGGFFFRDKPNVDSMYGLLSLGWNANGGESCNYASSIGEHQGMLFVR